MKMISRVTVLAIVATLCVCCATVEEQPRDTLLDNQGWCRRPVSDGVVLFSYAGYSSLCQSNQSVNVLQVDLRRNKMQVVDAPELDSLSSIVAGVEGVIAAINGSYFDEGATYVKIDNEVSLDVTIDTTNVMYWKHKAAIMLDPQTGVVDITGGTIEQYHASEFPTILSSAPLLIEDGVGVGLDFVGESIDPKILATLEYEDYRRHQGVRHPRAAVAMVDDHTLLLVTVDGRFWPNAGMSARELTHFLQYYFNPRDAINVDGGGSTTMYVKGAGVGGTDIVNFPTDNNRYDRYGQRAVKNALVIIPK